MGVAYLAKHCSVFLVVVNNIPLDLVLFFMLFVSELINSYPESCLQELFLCVCNFNFVSVIFQLFCINCLKFSKYQQYKLFLSDILVQVKDSLAVNFFNKFLNN